MELYYKDLISKDETLEDLVEQLSLVVQGAEEFARVACENAEEPRKTELTTGLEKLKEGCRKVRSHASRGAHATDLALRRNPYSFAGVAFGFGIVAGALVCLVLSRTRASRADRRSPN